MSKKTDPPVAEPQEAPASSAPVQGVTVSELVAPLPEVNEAAIAAEAQDQEQEKAKQEQEKPAATAKNAASPPPSPALQASKPDSTSKPAPTDSKGRTFDPRLHETTPEGRPIFCKESVYLKQRRHPLPGWKNASTVGEPPTSPDPAAPAPEAPAGPTAEQLKQSQQMAAATFAGLQLLIMRRAFGDSIAKKDSESEQLVGAWGAVLDHYGMGAMHPILGLAMVSAGLVLVNVNEPETRGKLARMRDWFERAALGLWQRIRRRFGWGARTVEVEPEEKPEPSAPATRSKPSEPINGDAAATTNGRRV